MKFSLSTSVAISAMATAATAATCNQSSATDLTDLTSQLLSMTGGSSKVKRATLDCGNGEQCIGAMGVYMCLNEANGAFKDSAGGSGNLYNFQYTAADGTKTSFDVGAFATDPAQSSVLASLSNLAAGATASTTGSQASATKTGSGTASMTETSMTSSTDGSASTTDSSSESDSATGTDASASETESASASAGGDSGSSASSGMLAHAAGVIFAIAALPAFAAAAL